MQLAKRNERGWLVRCDCARKAEFPVRRLGIAVECPSCGRTALSGDLTTEYWLRAGTGPVPGSVGQLSR